MSELAMHPRRLRRQIWPPSTFRCNVGNCGGGKCVHEVVKYRCPRCQKPLVLVTPTGHMFCPDWDNCGYEHEYSGEKVANTDQ